MGNMLNSAFGILAASSWLLLSATTAVGIAVGNAAYLKTNFAMTVLFGLVGGFLVWRTRVVARLRRAHPADPAASSFMKTQLMADLAMAVLGYTLAFAAVLRVWRENLPVFG
jgi:uncharacterized protein YfiM (DUF2279 family)